MQKSIRGFTLIELMIVIAIIGILAAIAIPAYRDYIARAQAAEAFSLLSGAKTPLGEFFAETGRWPTAIGSVTNAGTAGKYIATVSISGGANTSDPIELTAQIRNTNVSSLLAGKSILLTSTSGATWTCRSDNLSPNLLPLACR